MQFKSITRVGVVAAVTAFALTGCSGAQGAEKACQQVEKEYSALSSDLTAAFTQLSVDPEGTAETISEIENNAVELAHTVDDPDVRDAVDQTAKALSSLAAFAQQAPADLSSEEAGELADLMRNFESAKTVFNGVCY